MLTLTDELGLKIDKFKREVKNLQQQLGDILDAAGSYSKEKLTIGKNRINETVSNLKNSVQEKTSHAYEVAKRGGQQAIDKSRHSIAKRPFTAILAAFLTGAAVTAVVRLRKKEL